MPVMDRTARVAVSERHRQAAREQRPPDRGDPFVPEFAGDILRLQRIVGNQAVGRLIQRHCYEQFRSLAEAKAENPYAAAHLDEQKKHRISSHERKPFGTEERDNIYATNRAAYGRNQIISDSDGATVLTKSPLDATPHIDHRFPKSKGGSNSFKNAQVISAQENMTKGANAGTLTKEPDEPIGTYLELKDRGYVIGPGRNFDAAQKEALYEANEAMFGQIRSDTTGAPLGRIDSSQVPHIDHILPKSDGGCNYYFNAKVLPADENIEKGGTRKVFGKGTDEDDDDDYSTGTMSLEKYYRNKAAATQSRRGAGQKKYLGKDRYNPMGGPGKKGKRGGRTRENDD